MKTMTPGLECQRLYEDTVGVGVRALSTRELNKISGPELRELGRGQ